jgi:Cu/Ag efflux protein CusF
VRQHEQIEGRKTMTLKTAVSLASFAVISGCASYKLPPIAHHHPASVQAAASASRARSKTLEYSRADMPAIAVAAAAQEGHQDHQSSEPEAPQKTAVGEGKVIATVPGANQVVVEHGEIKGFMDAMTMGYRVEPPSLLEGLQSGDQVRFTIDVPRKAIIKIEKKK